MELESIFPKAWHGVKWTRCFPNLFFSFLKKFILLMCIWFTMLYSFLLYSRVIQLYIYTSFPYFSVSLITGYWIYFPVLYSRALLFIYFIYSSLYLLTPNSYFILPLSFSPLVTLILFFYLFIYFFATPWGMY